MGDTGRTELWVLFTQVDVLVGIPGSIARLSACGLQPLGRVQRSNNLGRREVYVTRRLNECSLRLLATVSGLFLCCASLHRAYNPRTVFCPEMTAKRKSLTVQCSAITHTAR